ncbi:MAG: TatD family deoxyribonuclease [Gammaproteobacteria bacterium]|nr:MAG: TatD family deoxyribonuclease [Gammaproteobacteria bacterium]
MKLIDTHCHLDFEVFNDDREQVLQEAGDVGLIGIVVPGTHQQGWKNLLSVCAAHDALYPAIGLHPMFLEQHQESDIEKLEYAINDSKPYAIGEIGLDYRDSVGDEGQQVFYFEQQVLLARKKELPVILHILKAHDQALKILRNSPVCGGTVHAFNGSLQQAEQYIELGFKLGFGGMLTYERSSKLRKLAADLPLESIVLETDAPDMTVFQHQYQRNSPVYLPYCLQALAGLRNETPDVIAAQTTENAISVFKLDKDRQ